MDPTLIRDIGRIEVLLAEKFGAASGRLDRRARKAGRNLPRWVRRDLDRLAAVQTMAGHPKLGRMVDTRKSLKAAARTRDWLDAVDVADRRRGRLLGMLGALSFNLILAFVLLIVVLRWRGLV